MSNFVIEEFTFYKITLHNNISDEDAECTIMIKLDDGAAYLHFMRGELPTNRIVQKGNYRDYHTYINLDKFHNYVDIMRYEKPLFFYYEVDTNRSYVTTSDEPVGEEESEAED